MRGAVLDLAGLTFGRLTVVKTAVDGSVKNTKTKWLCMCACGTERAVGSAALRTGLTKSCGCLHGDVMRARITHGKRHTLEYNNWVAMRSRCGNPNNSKFKYYGGIGVTVCDRWRNSFENFLEDMGPRPTPDHSLDRFPNPAGNYEPGNVRWATRSQQNLNKRHLVQEVTHA